MFSPNSKKQVPKSFDDCLKPDSVASKLWEWAERLELLGKILMIIILALGIFTSVVNGFSSVENEVFGSFSVSIIDFDWVSFVITLLYGALCAFVEYLIYNVLVLIVGSLASIVQNTKIAADVALFNSGKDDISTTNGETKDATDIKRANSKSYSDFLSKISDEAKENWTCKKCGTKNTSNSQYCKDCGEYK